MTNWAVFLNRDGTINQKANSLYGHDQVRLLPGAAQAIGRLNDHCIPVIVVTNQSGQAKDHYTQSTLSEIHQEIRRQLDHHGALIDHIYHCPHQPKEKCSCRKPRPGMLLEAAEAFQLDLGDSFMIGDKLSDLLAGRHAGCQTILVTNGSGDQIAAYSQTAAIPLSDFIAPDLPQAVEWILGQKTTIKESAILPPKRKLSINNEFIPIGLFTLILLILIALDVHGLPGFLPIIRLFLGLLFVILIPGYTLQAALFPRADELDGPERLALSFGLSVALVAPLAFSLDRLPWRIDLWPIAVILGLWVVIFSMVTSLRRRHVPPNQRFALQIDVDAAGWWVTQERTNRVLYIILTLSLLVAMIAALGIIFIPKPGQFMTEFYILGEERLAESYPREAAPAEKLTVTMGISNKERREKTYRAEIWAVDPWSENRALVGAAGPFNLEKDQAIEEKVAWFMPWPGDDQVVDFYLFNLDSDEPDSPYRQLRLWLNVTE